MNPVVVYWLDLRPGNLSYLQMCRNSVHSLRQVDSDIPVWVLCPAPIEESFDDLGAEVRVVAETFSPQRSGLHPRYSKYSVLDADFGEHDVVLVLDTDTFLNGAPTGILEHAQRADFAARPETGNSPESLERFNRWMSWARIRLVRNPTYTGAIWFNSGVYLLRARFGAAIAQALHRQLRVDHPSPVVFGKGEHFPSGDSEANVTAAMIEEVRFSDAVRATGLVTAEMSAAEHGFLWEQDPFDQATIFHTGGGQQYFQHLHRHPELAQRTGLRACSKPGSGPSRGSRA